MAQYQMVDDKTPIPAPTALQRAKGKLAQRLDQYGKMHQASAKRAGPTGKLRVLSAYDQVPASPENP